MNTEKIKHITEKSNRGVRALALLLAAVLLAVGVGTDFGVTPLVLPAYAASAYTDAKVQALEKELADINAQKSNLSSKIADARKDKTDAKELKNDLDRQLNLLTAKEETLNSLLSELEDQIGKKTLDMIDLQADITEQEKKFKERIRVVHEEGNASYLAILLGAESLYEFLIRIERVGSLLDYNTRIMKSLKADKETLRKQREDLLDIQERQRLYEQELINELANIDKLAEENAIYMDELSKKEASYQSTYAKYKAEEDKLNSELEAYIKEQQEKLNAQYVGGEFMWPVDLSYKKISSKYGGRWLYGTWDNHYGIDIPASYGAAIYAVNGGEVILATSHASYGNYIIIDHGGGKSTLYAHCSKLLVKKGAKVKKGDTIANVGSTGNSYGNHVHFEVRINGVRDDPMNYVKLPPGGWIAG